MAAPAPMPRTGARMRSSTRHPHRSRARALRAVVRFSRISRRPAASGSIGGSAIPVGRLALSTACLRERRPWPCVSWDCIVVTSADRSRLPPMYTGACYYGQPTSVDLARCRAYGWRAHTPFGIALHERAAQKLGARSDASAIAIGCPGLFASCSIAPSPAPHAGLLGFSEKKIDPAVHL